MTFAAAKTTKYLIICLSVVVWLWLGVSISKSISLFISSEKAVPTYDSKPYSEYLNYQLNYQVSSLLTSIKKANSHRSIRNINLVIEERKLNVLTNNLPHSGRKYIKGFMIENDDKLQIKLRLKGKSPKDWRPYKRSYRVRLKKPFKWQSINGFELMPINELSSLQQYLFYTLAKNTGLLTINVDIVNVNLNGQQQGLYLLVEELLGKQSIFNMNHIYSDVYQGEIAEYSFLDTALFERKQHWEKIINKGDRDSAQIDALINLLNQPEVNYKQLRLFLDYQHFSRFYAFNSLINRSNLTERQNWRLYYDKVLGRFKPILWDPETQNNIQFKSKLLDKLLKDEEFKKLYEYQRWQLSQQILEQLKLNENNFSELFQAIIDEPHPFYDLKDYRPSELLNNYKNWLSYFKNHLESVPKLSFLSGKKKVWQGSINLEGVTHVFEQVTVTAGTIIKLHANSQLIFHNGVNIKGSSQEPVQFQLLGNEQSAAIVTVFGHPRQQLAWQNCHFTGRRGKAHLKPSFTGMVNLLEAGKVSIYNCNFKHLAENSQEHEMDLLAIYRSNITIENSVFNDSLDDAIDIEFSQLLMINSEVSGNKNEAIDSRKSKIKIVDSKFANNLDNAISAGQQSVINLLNNTFSSNQTAVLSKDASRVFINCNQFKNNETELKARHKDNQFAAGGEIIIEQQNNLIPLNTSIDKKSKIFYKTRLNSAQQCNSN